MRKSLLLLILCVFVGSHSLWAQTKTISGQVTGAEDGLPIPGVAVMVKGTSVGTVTNADGNYSFQIPESATHLVVSYIGMKSQEVDVSNRTVINFTLQSEIREVDEVVVTALGISREKKALGYAVTDVKSEELSKSRGGVKTTLSILLPVRLQVFKLWVPLAIWVVLPKCLSVVSNQFRAITSLFL